MFFRRILLGDDVKAFHGQREVERSNDFCHALAKHFAGRITKHRLSGRIPADNIANDVERDKGVSGRIQGGAKASLAALQIGRPFGDPSIQLTIRRLQQFLLRAQGMLGVTHDQQ